MLGCGGEAGFSFNCRGYRKLAGASSFPARLLIMVHLLPWPPLAPSVMSSCCCLRADPSWARTKLFTAPPSSPSTHECGREFSACVWGTIATPGPSAAPPQGRYLQILVEQVHLYPWATECYALSCTQSLCSFAVEGCIHF